MADKICQFYFFIIIDVKTFNSVTSSRIDCLPEKPFGLLLESPNPTLEKYFTGCLIDLQKPLPQLPSSL